MERYEMSIKIQDISTVDNLIVALVRNGYSVYLSSNHFDICGKTEVCFTVDDEELTKIDKT